MDFNEFPSLNGIIKKSTFNGRKEGKERTENFRKEVRMNTEVIMIAREQNWSNVLKQVSK